MITLVKLIKLSDLKKKKKWYFSKAPSSNGSNFKVYLMTNMVKNIHNSLYNFFFFVYFKIRNFFSYYILLFFKTLASN